MVCLLLLQLEGEAVALEVGLLRGPAAKVGGPEVLRFGLAGTDTGSEPGRRVRLKYLSLHQALSSLSPQCTSLCQDRGPLQRAVRSLERCILASLSSAGREPPSSGAGCS